MNDPAPEELERLVPRGELGEGSWCAVVDNGAERVGVAGLTKGSAIRVRRLLRAKNPGAKTWIEREASTEKKL